LFIPAVATAAGIIASSEVVIAFLVAWLWLDEASSLLQIIVMAIVLVGITMIQTAHVNTVIGTGP
jgi:multidrug transporter EmrE-like cation transporter